MQYKNTLITRITSILIIIILSMPANSIEKDITLPETDAIIKEVGNYSEINNRLNPDQINILVWNIYKCKKKSWSQDFENLSRNKDILILQEGVLNSEITPLLLKNNSYKYTMASSFLYTKEAIPTGVVTASEIKPVFKKFFRSIGREPIIGTPKMILSTKYKIEGYSKSLLVVNIHSLNFVTTSKFSKQLFSVLDTIQNHDGPIIFGGDFNSWSDKKENFLKEFMAKIGLTEVLFENGDERKTFNGHILDYAFIKGLKVLSSHVYSNLDGSDHKAIEITLKVNR